MAKWPGACTVVDYSIPLAGSSAGDIRICFPISDGRLNLHHTKANPSKSVPPKTTKCQTYSMTASTDGRASAKFELRQLRSPPGLNANSPASRADAACSKSRLKVGKGREGAGSQTITFLRKTEQKQ
jgi:hypothetical protein